jgi:hypothetical protein
MFLDIVKTLLFALTGFYNLVVTNLVVINLWFCVVVRGRKKPSLSLHPGPSSGPGVNEKLVSRVIGLF